MNITDNKAIARRFIGIWGRESLDIIDELGSQNIVMTYPVMLEKVRGRDWFKKVMTNFRQAFPDSDIVVEDEIAEGDKVVVRWTFSGTHSGNFLGLAPTGKQVRWTGITIFTLLGGKITEERGEEDFLGFLRQIGLLSPVS
jgi:steroid delta-isomerase-like uncharacterized protein